MALIKNIIKPESNARIAVAIKESAVRRLHAYRLFLETEGGYRPTLAETVELFLQHIYSEDKSFGKWYDERNSAQVSAVDALMSAKASVVTTADDASQN